MSAAASTTETSRSWTKESTPSANAAGIVTSAANRTRSADTIADTPALATFMSEQTRLVWPAGYGLRRIPVTDPTPVYPHSLLWHRDNPHPALATLRAHLAATAASHDAAGTWAPDWAIPR
ncbi:hypothetical protein AB0J35_29820 [Nonomuraea angiospora]|uniref:hypothetical protein n=1 Tax=Nonomuraea angiospora TaxID=46172 RepID=UPI0034469AEA